MDTIKSRAFRQWKDGDMPNKISRDNGFPVTKILDWIRVWQKHENAHRENTQLTQR